MLISFIKTYLFLSGLGFYIFSQDALAQKPSMKLLLPVSPDWDVVNEGDTLSFSLQDEGVDHVYVYNISNGRFSGMEMGTLGNFKWTTGNDMVDRLVEHKTYQVI